MTITMTRTVTSTMPMIRKPFAPITLHEQRHQTIGKKSNGELLYRGALIVKVASSGGLEFNGFYLRWYDESKDPEFGTEDDWLNRASIQICRYETSLKKDYHINLGFRDKIIESERLTHGETGMTQRNPNLFITASRKTNRVDVIAERVKTARHLEQVEQKALAEYNALSKKLNEMKNHVKSNPQTLNGIRATISEMHHIWSEASNLLNNFCPVPFQKFGLEYKKILDIK